jgi:hypothetical protein
MRLRIGGKIGPLRGGVSVGRSGVGWGAGAGPIGVTGGTRSRSKPGGNSGSSYSDISNVLTHEPFVDDHPEDSYAFLLTTGGGVLLMGAAIWTIPILFETDKYGESAIRPPVGYWIYLAASIGITLLGSLLIGADRSYFKKTGEFRPTIFGDRKDESRFYKSKPKPQAKPKAELVQGRRGLAGWLGLASVTSSTDQSRSEKDSVKVDTLAVQKWLSHHSLTKSPEDLAVIADAIEIILNSGIGSTSLLQRKLKIGFSRAVNIMDELENLGVVGPAEGSKARLVLLNISEIHHC